MSYSCSAASALLLTALLSVPTVYGEAATDTPTATPIATLTPTLGPTATPTPTPIPAWRFAVLGDMRAEDKNSTTGISDQVLQAFAADIVSQVPPIDLAIVTGDIATGGIILDFHDKKPTLADMYTAWKSDMKPVYDANIPVYLVRGNHETHTKLWYGVDNDTAEWMTYFGNSMPQNGPDTEKGLTYSFTHKQALLIGLDQYMLPGTNYEQPEADVGWLNNQLQPLPNGVSHVFVYAHAPAVQASIDTTLEWDISGPNGRDAFLTSLMGAGVKSFLCGHDHFYNRALLTMPDGAGQIWQIIAGSGTSSLASWDGTYAAHYPSDDIGVTGVYHNQTLNGYQIITVDGEVLTSSFRVVALPSATVTPGYLDTFYMNNMIVPTPTPTPTGPVTLTGKIEDTDENPVAAALVSSNLGVTVSDADGAYDFEGTSAGASYSLRFSKHNHSFLQAVIEGTIVPGHQPPVALAQKNVVDEKGCLRKGMLGSLLSAGRSATLVRELGNQVIQYLEEAASSSSQREKLLSILQRTTDAMKRGHATVVIQSSRLPHVVLSRCPSALHCAPTSDLRKRVVSYRKAVRSMLSHINGAVEGLRLYAPAYRSMAAEAAANAKRSANIVNRYLGAFPERTEVCGG
jgi:hypothetical protein